MRKFIAIALVFTMALGLTACAGGGSEIHRLNMATGGDAGTYYAFGGVIASVLTSKIDNVEVTAQTSGGSIDNARKLMTKDRGRGNVGCTLVAFIDMNVGTADAASFDVDQNVAPAHGRLCRFLDSEVVLSIEDRAFHGDSLTWR